MLMDGFRLVFDCDADVLSSSGLRSPKPESIRFRATFGVTVESRGPSRYSTYSGVRCVDGFDCKGGVMTPGAASVDSAMIQVRALKSMSPLPFRRGRPSEPRTCWAPAVKAR